MCTDGNCTKLFALLAVTSFVLGGYGYFILPKEAAGDLYVQPQGILSRRSKEPEILSRRTNPLYIKARCNVKQRCSVENPFRQYAAGGSSTSAAGTEWTQYLPGRDCVFERSTTIKSYLLPAAVYAISSHNLPALETKNTQDLTASWQTYVESNENSLLPIGMLQSMYAPSVLCDSNQWPTKHGTWRNVATQMTEWTNALIKQQKDPYGTPVANGKRYAEYGCNPTGNESFVQHYNEQLSPEPSTWPNMKNNQPYMDVPTLLGLPTKHGPFGNGCPCLWEEEDDDKNINGIDIDCVLNGASTIEHMWDRMADQTAEGDVNVMEHEMLTMIPYFYSIDCGLVWSDCSLLRHGSLYFLGIGVFLTLSVCKCVFDANKKKKQEGGGESRRRKTRDDIQLTNVQVVCD